MMDGTKRWALLIGVDYYFKGTERTITYQHLNGCVRDVLAIENYLQSVGPCDITKLTASNGGDKPTEDESAWPTHDNIVNELKRIKDAASPGDLVYIHYSGHGIRRDKLRQQDEEGDNISGTALVPTDVLTGKAYLTGYQLGVWIRNMVEGKKLRVTLVLDSCFSGRGMRDMDNTASFAVRTSVDRFDDFWLSSDNAAEKAAEKAAEEAAKKAADTAGDTNIPSEPVHRNIAVRQSWLSNPVGCTVLTACGVDETAGEQIFGSAQDRNGVLTHWMLDILRRHPKGRPPTYTRVREHVASRIRSKESKLKQSPVLYGDDYYEFFGEKPLVQRPACRVLKKQGNYVELDVGRAQGVAAGAIYDVYPETWDIEWGSTTDDLGPQNISPPQVRVDTVLDFQCKAILLAQDDATPENTVVETGSRAVLQTWALGSDIYVQFDCPPSRPNVEEFRNSLRMEIENTPGLHLCTDDAATRKAFIVSINQHQHFEFHDEKGVRLSRLPKISLEDAEGSKKLAHILRHLARFQAIQGLQNSNPQSSLSPANFTFELLDTNEKPLPKASSGKYEIEEGQAITISFVNNKLLKPVHVAFFSLNATWGIEKLSPQGGQPSEEAFGHNPVRCTVEMEIPGKASEDDPSEIDDTIKACVYAGEPPLSWDELALPNLPLEVSLIWPDTPVEAAFVGYDPVADAHRNPKAVTTPSTMREGRWAILDFIVHTSPLSD